MAELPERFDSKRELDAWLAKHVSGLNDVEWRTVNMAGKEALTYIDDAYTEFQPVPPYTTNREAALDLLEAFCEEHGLDFKVYPQQVEIKRTAGFVGMWTVKEAYDEDYKIDPLAVSVTIYRAFKQIEEANRDS